MSSILENLAAPGRGVVLSSRGTPLQRLHYFDGKFLRAEHLREEQDYLRALTAFANRASGVGIVHGFEVERADGDRVAVRPGLATDAAGRTLLLQSSEDVSVAELILASRGSSTSGSSWEPTGGPESFEECAGEVITDDGDGLDDLYLISVHPTDRLCGTEDVYGLLCEQACYTDTQHPYIREGVLLRATPLELDTPLRVADAVALEDDRYWRSRVASAFFADERGDPASLISGAGLRSGAWCRGAAARSGTGVPLAVVGRRGSATRFLDLWTVRRERMEASPRRYWASRMAMRPWDVFLAQVLQFQCQLTDLGFREGEAPGGEEDCRDAMASAAGLVGTVKQHMSDLRRELEQKAARLEEQGNDERAAEIRAEMDEVMARELMPLMLEQMNALGSRITGYLDRPAPARRILLDRGIVELPPAGYLPVVPGEAPVERQIRALMGEGVDLRFCAVRPDFVPHAFEEAQHMERISLVQGLDDPASKPRVDILVPDGEVTDTVGSEVARGYDMTLALDPLWLQRILRAPKATDHAAGGNDYQTARRSIASVRSLVPSFHGAGRSEATPGGGAAFYFAGIVGQDPSGGLALLRRCAGGSQELGSLDKGEFLRANREHLDQRLDEDQLMTMWRASGSGAGVSVDVDGGGEVEATASTTAEADAEAKVEARRAAEADRESEIRKEMESAQADRARASRPGGAALWMSMSADQDPFSMQEGGITRLHLELYVISAGVEGAPVFGRLAFDGYLTVEEAAVHAGVGRVVSGALDGNADSGDGGESLHGTVQLRKVPGSSEPDIELAFDGSPGFSYRVQRNWDGPAEARVCGGRSTRYGLRTKGQDEASADKGMDTLASARRKEVAGAGTKPEMAANQTLDPASLRPGSDAYADSIEALDLFRRQEPGLAAVWQRRLFATPDEGRAESRVLPRHGWVLFHRRREKNCGEVEPSTSPVRRHRLRTFYVEVSEKNRDRVLGALQEMDEAVLGSLRWQSLGAMEFRPGERTPYDGGAALRGAWAAASLEGNRVHLGAVGSGDYDALGGQALAEGRIRKTLGVLGSAADVGEAGVAVLPSVPGGVGSGGTDGVLLYVVQRSVEGEEGVSSIEAFAHDANGGAVAGVQITLSGCGPQSVVGSGVESGAHCTSEEAITDGRTGVGGSFRVTGQPDGFYRLRVTDVPEPFAGVTPKIVVFELRDAARRQFDFTVV